MLREMSRALLMQGLVLKSLCSDSGTELPDCCIQLWRAAWYALQLAMRAQRNQCRRHKNGMVPRGQHDGVEQNAYPRSHDVRIGQDPKNELVMDAFVVRIRWGADAVSAANTNTATMNRCLGRQPENERTRDCRLAFVHVATIGA